ncbi:MAG TPA: hypothetical protein VHQ65_17330 [Thermoanaerobaculia bacterium]|nr:hypothetical protein [Thermoanaerobaculia bacterium]
MTGDHLTTKAIGGFLRGELDTAAAAATLRHLLAGCAECSALLRAHLNRRRAATGDGYDGALLRSLAFVADKEAPLALERIAAPGLVARLLEVSEEQQKLLIENDERFRTWGVCERLIQESRQTLWDLQPAILLRQSRCAVELSERLDTAVYGEDYVKDLQAEAWSTLGNAHRVRGEFLAARRALARSQELLAQGTGDDVEAARLVSYEASLLIDQGQFEHAVRLLDRYVRRLGQYGETQLQGKLLVQKGQALGFYDPEAAIPVNRQALALLDGAESPRLTAAARHGLIWSLDATGRSHEALMQFQASRRLFTQFSDPWSKLNTAWTEARLAFSLGKVEEAEAVYRQVWEQAYSLGLERQTAFISLDLIEVNIVLGRTEEAAQLATRSIELFQAWGVHRRAMQSWSLLVEALRREETSRTTRKLVADLHVYLARAWKNPEYQGVS